MSDVYFSKVQYIIPGRMLVKMNDGSKEEFGPGEICKF
jgi:hypothetical protein